MSMSTQDTTWATPPLLLIRLEFSRILVHDPFFIISSIFKLCKLLIMQNMLLKSQLGPQTAQVIFNYIHRHYLSVTASYPNIWSSHKSYSSVSREHL